MTRRRGFTLIELMLVVAIIGLLAAIALPKFANLVIKAKEAAIKGKLGALRSAVSIYYADHEGQFATNLDSLIVNQKYLDQIPRISIPTFPSHAESNGVNASSLIDWDSTALPAGGTAPPYVWLYRLSNDLRVNCTHTDSKGTTWSLW